jgi:hypothetical protein
MADRLMLCHFGQPRILLGLTATPERSDGQSILCYFDNRPDGSPAVEMRLWNALELQLLCPFEYYACDDDTDFSEVPWEKPGELAAIDNLVTGNDVRARLVLNEWRRLAGDPSRGRALVFCSSVAHAEYMTNKINQAGIRALCVVGHTSQDERRRPTSTRWLAARDCTHNRGDRPGDTVLLLLHQSGIVPPTICLRLATGKESVHPFVDTPTEFVDRLHHDYLHANNRCSEGLGALPLVAISSAPDARPSPNSLRRLVQQNWRPRTELQTYAAWRGRNNIRPVTFLREQGIELDDYRGTDARLTNPARCWFAYDPRVMRTNILSPFWRLPFDDPVH